MKRPRHVWNRKPRPKGWKRTVTHVTKTQQTERDYRPVPIDGNGYLLAPCLVLAAAAIGTRAAYFAAMYWLNAARDIDARRFA